VEGGKRRPVLDGELVERQVVGGEPERHPEFARPVVRGLPGAGVDQIEGQPREGGARHLDRRAGGRHVVQPAEEAEVRVVQRLDAERDAVDARRAVATEARRLDTRRIGLERDFRIVCDRPVLRHGLEDRAHRRRLHQRRRAAAEEDARDGAALRPVRGRLDLADEGGGEARLIRRLVADVRIEVAIGALGGAERPVHVDPSHPLA
jgi:hypothetical protein